MLIQIAIELVSENDQLINETLVSTASLQEKVECLVGNILSHICKNKAFAALLLLDISFAGKPANKKSDFSVNKKLETEAQVRKIFQSHRDDSKFSSTFTLDENIDTFFIVIEGAVKRIIQNKFKNVRVAQQYVIKVLRAVLFRKAVNEK